MGVDVFCVPWGAAPELPVEGRGFSFLLGDCTKGTGSSVRTASPPTSPMNKSAGEGERGLQWVGRAPLRSAPLTSAGVPSKSQSQAQG